MAAFLTGAGLSLLTYKYVSTSLFAAHAMIGLSSESTATMTASMCGPVRSG